jgi:hypothetical protein
MQIFKGARFVSTFFILFLISVCPLQANTPCFIENLQEALKKPQKIVVQAIEQKKIESDWKKEKKIWLGFDQLSEHNIQVLKAQLSHSLQQNEITPDMVSQRLVQLKNEWIEVRMEKRRAEILNDCYLKKLCWKKGQSGRKGVEERLGIARKYVSKNAEQFDKVAFEIPEVRRIREWTLSDGRRLEDVVRGHFKGFSTQEIETITKIVGTLEDVDLELKGALILALPQKMNASEKALLFEWLDYIPHLTNTQLKNSVDHIEQLFVDFPMGRSYEFRRFHKLQEKIKKYDRTLLEEKAEKEWAKRRKKEDFYSWKEVQPSMRKNFRDLTYACYSRKANQAQGHSAAFYVKAMALTQFLITGEAYFESHIDHRWTAKTYKGFAWEILVETVTSYMLSSLISRSQASFIKKHLYQNLYYIVSEAALYQKILFGEDLYSFLIDNEKIPGDQWFKMASEKAHKDEMKNLVGLVQENGRGAQEQLSQKVERLSDYGESERKLDTFLRDIIFKKKELVGQVPFLEETRDLYAGAIAEKIAGQDPTEANKIYRFNRFWDAALGGPEQLAVGLMTYHLLCLNAAKSPLWRYGLVFAITGAESLIHDSFYYHLRVDTINAGPQESPAKAD